MLCSVLVSAALYTHIVLASMLCCCKLGGCACRWLIVGVHEPKYSSTQPSAQFATGIHLTSEIENELGEAVLPSSPRTGYLGYEMITSLESLFYQYGVDLVLTGHEHNYERSYPVYLDKVRSLYASAGIADLTSTACCCSVQTKLWCSVA